MPIMAYSLSEIRQMLELTSHPNIKNFDVSIRFAPSSSNGTADDARVTSCRVVLRGSLSPSSLSVGQPRRLPTEPTRPNKRRRPRADSILEHCFARARARRLAYNDNDDVARRVRSRFRLLPLLLADTIYRLPTTRDATTTTLVALNARRLAGAANHYGRRAGERTGARHPTVGLNQQQRACRQQQV